MSFFVLTTPESLPINLRDEDGGTYPVEPSGALSTSLPVTMRGTVPAGGGSVTVDTHYTPGVSEGASVLFQAVAFDVVAPAVSVQSKQVALRTTGAGVMTVAGTGAIVAATGDAGLAAWTVTAGVSASNTLTFTFTTPGAYANEVAFAAEFLAVSST